MIDIMAFSWFCEKWAKPGIGNSLLIHAGDIVY